MSQIVIGIGSGRCGTTSLSYLLSGCRGVLVTHEEIPGPRWPPKPKHAGKALRFLVEGRFEDVSGVRAPHTTGDVALYWGPYVEEMIGYIPDLRVIGLIREKAACVESLHETFQTDSYITQPAVQAYPTVEGEGREAWANYWDLYHDLITSLAKKHPDNVTAIRTEEMSTREGQRKVFRAAGIAPADWRFQDECRHHTREEIHQLAA